MLKITQAGVWLDGYTTALRLKKEVSKEDLTLLISEVAKLIEAVEVEKKTIENRANAKRKSIVPENNSNVDDDALPF